MKKCNNTLSGRFRRNTARAAFVIIAMLTFSSMGVAQDAPKKQRIISSSPAATEILFAIGAGDEVVGVDNSSKFPPEATKRENIGVLGGANVETLIALQPTLIVIYGKQPDLEAFCAKRGIKKVNVMIENILDVGETIVTLGKATGHEREAELLGAQLEEALLTVMVRGARDNPTRTLLVIGRDVGSFQNVLSIGKGSFLDELVTMAGGKNVFADVKQPYPMISTEQIIAAAPDVIIEMSGESGKKRDVEQLKKDWQVFKSVPAVKNGRIEFMSGDHLLIPGPRIGKTAEELVKILHPQAER